MKYNQEDYHRIMQLFSKQNWLLNKESQLEELILFCNNSESKNLIFSLLERFHYLHNDYLNTILKEIADYIVNKSNFKFDKTQVLAITFDDEADSSQKVLDMLKVPLFEKGWRNVKTVNHFKSCVSNYGKGKTQILIVDEFIGSGRTLTTRIMELRRNLGGNKFELQCCFIAGIKTTIEKLKNEGLEIFCPLQIERGISEYYKNDDLSNAINIMLDLESRLSQRINDKLLYDYMFGYGHVEALYSLQGCNGNTPNNVFPIFWWPKDVNENDRNTLLIRVEKGF